MSKLIWIDDEVDLLKPHIVFLENKGYDVSPVNNVNEALEMIEKENFQLALLDENMPGISGLEAIPMIKNIDSAIKIVMVTKNEEEQIMEQAIGSQIADYILKPVNPNQVLLYFKKEPSGRYFGRAENHFGISTGIPKSFHGAFLSENLPRLGGILQENPELGN
jgi:Response regulator containing CheY-like receiver, AAA-type ATPase, and DNA-binding domains